MAINALFIDKAPGCDGLTSNYIRKPIFDMLNKSIINGTLYTTVKWGIISLILKPGKDLIILDNLTPVTLLNNDYKLLAYVFTNSFKFGITQIISDTQLHKKLIYSQQLIMTLIDYSYLIEDK